MPLQKLFFYKGIDFDSSPQAFKEGDGKFRIDVRISNPNSGDKQSAENVLGNELVAFVLPVGLNTVIGCYDYKLDKKNYYFVYNSLSNHSILEYNQVTNVVATVFQSSILNFKKEALITGINIIRIDTNKTLLYWTDGWISSNNQDDYNEPKKINIEKGKAFMAGLTTGYKVPFNPEILFRIKQPPLFSAVYTWSGLNNNKEEFKATSNFTSATFGTAPETKTIIFDNAYFNPTLQYQPLTGKWKVATSGNYNINAAISLRAIIGDFSGMDYAEANILVNGVIKSRSRVSGGSFITTAVYIAQELALISNDEVWIVLTLYFHNHSANIFQAQGANFSSLKILPQYSSLNNLYKKLFQFKVQFIYDDYEISAWSPISKYYLPNTIGGGSSGEEIQQQDNLITVQVPTGNSIVTKINIAAREIGTFTPPLLSAIDFSLIATLDKAKLNIIDDSIYLFNFDNTITGIPLEVNESDKLFDWVPLTSQSQELIKGTKIVDGLITENFDPVEIDMRLKLNSTPIQVQTSSSGNSFFPYQSYYKSGSKRQIGTIYYDHANRSGLTNITVGDSNVLLPNGIYGTSLTIPFLTEKSYPAQGVNPNAFMSYVPIVTSEIYSRPPLWATHYQIVSSKNQTMGRYIQFSAQSLKYTDDEGTTTPAASATQLVVNVGNISGRYKVENPNSTLVYDFIKGDRIRFIATIVAENNLTDLNPILDFNEIEIASFDPLTEFIVMKLGVNTPNIFRSFTLPSVIGNGILFEIYNPTFASVNDREFIYEIGECYGISTDSNGNKIHLGKQGEQNQGYYEFFDNYFNGTTGFIGVGASGFSIGDKIKIQQNAGFQFSEYNTYTTIISITNSGPNEIITTDIQWQGNSATTGGVITKAAIVTLSGGDCFRRFCNMPRNDGMGGVNRLYSYIESNTASDLFTSNAHNYGRPNIVDDNVKRITRPSTIRYSQNLIPETFINGLSSVFDNNFETYDLPYGGIYKLFYDNQRLIMFQELKIGAILIEQTSFNDFTGQNVVGASTVVLNPQVIYYEALLGIGKHPESFAYYNGAMYGIDINRSVVWRLSNNGLTQISSTYKMANYFNHKCAEVLTSVNKVNIYGVYDVYFGEYIIAFSEFANGNAVIVSGETLAFNELENFWSTFYSYKPEMICSNGINIVSFKDGKLYRHNSGSVYANFYGVQYKPGLWFYCNIFPSNVKVYEAISLEAADPWNVIVETSVTQENPQGQHTELIGANFELKEGVWYSEILKDDYTPNIVTGSPYLPDARFTGNVMRGRYALIKLEFQGTGYTRIFASNILVIGSDRSNK